MSEQTEQEAPNADDAGLTGATRSWVCEHCNQTFRRAEHLQRHERRHLGHLPFHCPLCSRQFSRRDTLKRHLGTHQLSPEQTAALAKATDAGPSKACTNCAKSKQKCDRDMPCGRCRKRKLQCSVATNQPNDGFDVISSSQTSSHHGESSRNTPHMNRESVHRQDPFAAVGGCVMYDHGISRAFAPSVPVASTSFGSLQDDQDTLNHETTDALLDYRLEPALAGTLVPTHNVAPTLNTTGSWFYPIPTWEYGMDIDIEGFRAPTETRYAKMPDTYDEKEGLASQDATFVTNTSVISLRLREQLPRYVSSMIDDNDTLAAETHFHVPQFSNVVYESIRTSFLIHRDRLTLALGSDLAFPEANVLGTFVQLFFEYTHQQIPVLHLATYNPNYESWILVLAVGAVGSQYSQVSNQANLAVSLRELLSEAILDRVGCNPRVIGDLAFGQAVLLSQLLLQCSGGLASSLRSQYQKGILTAICRSVVSKNGSLFRTGKAVSQPWRRAEDWHKWIEQESWTRLAFFSLFLEHMQSVIWDINPPIEVADIHRQLPDSDRLWACTSAIEWEKQRMIYPPQITMPTFADLFTSEETFQSYCKDLEEPARIIVMSTVFSEEKKLQRDAQGWLHQRILKQHGIAPGKGRSCSTALFPLDQEFEMVSQNLPDLAPSTEILHKTYHTISILRRVSQTELYLYFGWMTTPEVTQQARENLAYWIQNDLQSTKDCLLHAASLFRLIRDQKVTAFSDLFCLLIATIFMRVLVDLDDAAMSQVNDQYPILRVDQEIEDDVRTSWLKGATQFRLYVTGIGLLDGSRSAQRIVKEAIRILNRDTGWKDLCSNVASTLGHLLCGSVPKTPDMTP
ncbi:hypothetical protein BN1723_005440 [Verticillium longisporum]|uniref:Zn(2)-C6 fungal-type domain-containing protein n=1 Tax=Verticillium longisporum TaxID=100787 RepID=A0A0G4L138_VERLO|nr:hypothetical protein BN1708_011524 [Verticillium longisporum]CRK42831.1 hypothetical protein BN1723_005440 [Verticillium longisporum]